MRRHSDQEQVATAQGDALDSSLNFAFRNAREDRGFASLRLLQVRSYSAVKVPNVGSEPISHKAIELIFGKISIGSMVIGREAHRSFSNLRTFALD